MQTWLVPVVVSAVSLGLVAVVIGVVVAPRSSREGRTVTDVVPGREPFAAGPAGPVLLQRIGLTGLVQEATGSVQWRVGTHELVAARTDGRGWATARGSTRTTSRVSGVSHSLVALRLPGTLPTVNVLRDGVIGSHVDVESSAFNQARDIRTDDDRLAHAVLTPRVIALLQDLPQDLSVQIVGDHLLSFRRGAPKADEVLARGTSLVQIAEAIPAFVYQGLDG